MDRQEMRVVRGSGPAAQLEETEVSELPAHIDDQAPVVVRQELWIDAPPEQVWAIHTDPRTWPAWQTDIGTLQASAERLSPGVTFDWTTAGLSIHTTVYEVNEDTHETLWGGPAPGITAVHHWRFLAEAGGTRVQTEESWDGEAVRADVAGMCRALDASLVAWLTKLKGHAEQKTLP